MAEIDLGTVRNTGHWSPIPLDLSDLAAVHDLTTATFLVEVRPELGSTIKLMQWRTGGSLITLSNSIVYDNTEKTLALEAPSTGLLAAFPTGGDFFWEVGFFLASAPTDLRVIGYGPFPVIDGVIR